MPNRDDIINEARSMIGVKWAHQGRSRRGIDCLGLCLVVGKQLGLIDPSRDKTNYPRRPDGNRLIEEIKTVLDIKDIKDMAPGDILVFREYAYACHMAFLSQKHGKRYIIHAEANRKKVLEEPLNQSGREDKIVACFCFGGLDG